MNKHRYYDDEWNRAEWREIKMAPERPYKYNEDKALQEITDYINKTYGEHYSQNKYQATEFIIDGGHGTGFCIGNVLKYAQRYGNKGGSQDWRLQRNGPRTERRRTGTRGHAGRRGA